MRDRERSFVGLILILALAAGCGPSLLTAQDRLDSVLIEAEPRPQDLLGTWVWYTFHPLILHAEEVLTIEEVLPNGKLRGRYASAPPLTEEVEIEITLTGRTVEFTVPRWGKLSLTYQAVGQAGEDKAQPTRITGRLLTAKRVHGATVVIPSPVFIAGPPPR